MTILLTNDDGIDAPGLAALVEALAGLDELVIVAPTRNRSGVGHAITLDQPIRVSKPDPIPGVAARYAIDGTPADAVKYAFKVALPSPPALVVSGINNGPNVGVNVLYSGTLGAALEALLHGTPSLAVSVESHDNPLWEGARHYARLLAARLLASSETDPLCLNLNVPSLPLEEIKGLKLTRHGSSGFDEYFHPVDNNGAFRLDGEMHVRDREDDFDAPALYAGYASLTPLHIDLTDHAARESAEILINGDEH